MIEDGGINPLPPASKRGEPQPQERRGHRRAYAALDLGTNNCRLLVATPTWSGFRVIDAFSRLVRLGEGLGTSSRLNEAAMRRTIDALRVCAAKMTNRGVTRSRLIATQACRAAENGAAFIERVHQETGLALEIIDQQTEAMLAAAGCASLADPQADFTVLFDIGGGSSEIVLLQRRQPPSRDIASRVVEWASLPLGVVTIAERHGGTQVSREQFDGMVDEVESHLIDFVARCGRSIGPGSYHLLGTSGTVTTLAGIHLNLPRYDRRQVDGLWMSAAALGVVVGDLLAMDHEARTRSPCVGPERADLVLAGCAILEAIRRAFPCERLRVADRGLREGILTEMMTRDGAWRRRREQW